MKFLHVQEHEKSKWRLYYENHFRNTLWIPMILALMVNYFIESMARQWGGGGLMFLLGSPLVFIYNSIIIFASLSVGILFRRKILYYFFLSATWVVLGVINGAILSNRMTPFTTKDIANVKDGLTIATNYFSRQALIAGAVVIGIALIGVAIFWLKGPKSGKIIYGRVIPLFLVIMIGTFTVSGIAIKAGVVDTYFGNLAYAYRDFGFPYCFINTWLNTGIQKPANYGPDVATRIFNPEELGEDGIMELAFEDDKIKHPNIIMLQLESFSDPDWYKDVEFSRDPIPTFRSLSEKFSSGNLRVPSVGAGTANTEFEVMSGISVKSFGPGEYPYKSVLLKTSLETVGYDLKSIGFSTHAIHNHRGAFYGRNKVFANLGYDTFTSLEYMNNVIKTPKNWAKDGVLTGYIMDALKSTENEDYIYTVSVEGHGSYPSEEVLINPDIKVLSAPTEEDKWQYEYYANLLYGMDNFVKDLISELSRHKERVVLVIYGDHLPAIDFTQDDLTTNDLYITPYVIWSNYWLPREEKEIAAYQLSADILKKLKINTGTLMVYHQNHQEDPGYLENLETLAYDMLYGKKYIYGGINPFEPTKLQMGINKIKIKEVVQIGSEYYIKGENFTPFSKISLDGNILNTIYLGPTILGLLEKVDPDDAGQMKVSQVEKNKEILSTTE